MATFSVRFLGCKVSHSDAHAIREALLRDGHEERGGAEIAVVNTCCVTNEAVRKSRQAASRAARTHRRVYVTGCAANLERAFAGLPSVAVVSRRAEALRRSCGRRRRNRMCSGRCAARPCPRFCPRQDGCKLLVQVLRDPLVRGRSQVAAPARFCGGIGGSSRAIAVVLTGINLGCFRDRERGYTLARLVREAGATPGLQRPPVVDLASAMSEELVRRCGNTYRVRHLRSAVGRRPGAERHGSALRPNHLRRLSPLADFNLTADVIVSDRDEQAFEQTRRVLARRV